MHIDDLPRLSDEERELADDPYAVIPSAPLIVPKRPRGLFRRVLAVLTVVFTLSACAMSPAQRKWAGIAAGVLVVGAIVTHERNEQSAPAGPSVPTPSTPCTANPEICR